MSRKNTEADFWKRVDKTSSSRGCWEYTGGKNKDGYGVFWYKNQCYTTHRFSMMIAGHDPTGWHVMHSCDNPSCVNPAHLSLGTHLDNMKDRDLKGRNVRSPKAGKPRKLNDDQVREIRSSNEHPKILAPKYNVSHYTISDVKKHKFYKEIL